MRRCEQRQATVQAGRRRDIQNGRLSEADRARAPPDAGARVVRDSLTHRAAASNRAGVAGDDVVV